MDTWVAQSMHGYPRADVEEFLESAAAEKARLEGEIADANARIARARSAIGSHRVMVAMLLKAQQELSEIRRTAEDEAERILARAELEAQAIEGGGAVQLGGTSSVEGWRDPSPRQPPMLDLATEQRDAGADEFFDYLRGALIDEQPLGPVPE
jgi:hypothetical protein